MPIPPFDSILNVLPPFLGDPRVSGGHSPYICTTEELCQRFSFSPKRREILHGFLRLRKALFELGIEGFQWLDGSFLEDIETQEGRAPGDIDVVTFLSKPFDQNDLEALVRANSWLLDPREIKARYSTDHYLVPLGEAPRVLVSQTRYWYGLFCHRRDGTWKGMLSVELNNPSDDAAAATVLEASSVELNDPRNDDAVQKHPWRPMPRGICFLPPESDDAAATEFLEQRHDRA